MRLLALLWRKQKHSTLAAILACLFQTIFNIGIINFLGRFAIQIPQSPSSWALFLMLSIGMVATQAAAVLLSEKISLEIARDLRTNLLIQIDLAHLERIEEVGADRTNIAYSDDIQRISESVGALIYLLKDLAFIFGVFLFLLWLAPIMTSLLAAVLTFGMIILLLLRTRALRYGRLHRSALDKAVNMFKEFNAGLKQVKTSTSIRSAFFDELEMTNKQVTYFGRRMGVFFAAGVQSTVLLYLVCQLFAALIHLDHSTTPATTSIFVLGLLVVLNPLLNLTTNIRQLAVGALSQNRLQAIVAALKSDDIQHSHREPIEAKNEPAKTSLELRGLAHNYKTEARQEFTLGPIDLTVWGGQALFITGGNGTGKTTLVKLVAGLYLPNTGSVLVNNQNITGRSAKGLHPYRVSAVFADTCLFSSLAHSNYDVQLRELSTAGIQLVKLNSVLSPTKSLLLQATSCSTGERKRLAFLLASADDAPVYIFDEYAADQDPNAKHHFYNTIIPELKRRGKIVIVVTHDERYFDTADVLLQLERGYPPRIKAKAEAIQQTSPASLTAELDVYAHHYTDDDGPAS